MNLSESQQERSERLQDELIDTITNLIHWLTAIQTEVVNGTYTSEKAEKDWLALTEGENMDILSILSEYMFCERGQE